MGYRQKLFQDRKRMFFSISCKRAPDVRCARCVKSVPQPEFQSECHMAGVPD